MHVLAQFAKIDIHALDQIQQGLPTLQTARGRISQNGITFQLRNLQAFGQSPGQGLQEGIQYFLSVIKLGSGQEGGIACQIGDHQETFHIDCSLPRAGDGRLCRPLQDHLPGLMADRQADFKAGIARFGKHIDLAAMLLHHAV